MIINEGYIRQIARSETVFDMAAICYKILENNISNPIKFVSDYVDESGLPAAENPNYQLLRDFSDQISEVLEQYSEFNFPYQRLMIVELLQNMNLNSFQKDKENQLTAIYTLLSTIDSMVPFWNEARIIERTSLNRGQSKSTHLVYLASWLFFHEELISKIAKERKRSADFGEGLSHLLFLQKKMMPSKANAPEICFLPYKRQTRQYQFKVAIIVGVTGKHFTMPRTVGTTQIIEYTKNAQKEVGEIVWQKIEVAIQLGAEFIVLPEFSVSEEILELIKGKLNERRKLVKGRTDLIAIFPGSTWITSENNVHNNVQIILDASGREIGRYYKNTPYRKRRKGAKGYESSEGISNPGYRTSILWVDGIGYVLPATCRDVIDGEYTDYLVQKFYPTFLMIPAWSSSGNSFKRPMESFAADYFVNSVLCNGCGALSRNASIMGGVAIVSKQDTVSAGLFERVKKNIDCDKVCRKECKKFCSYLVQIDFDPVKLEQKERILFQEI